MTLTADRAIAAAGRWIEVEEAIERWRGLGLAATRQEVDDIYQATLAPARRALDE